MSVSRAKWKDARERYEAHTADADTLAEAAIDELDGDTDAQDVAALVAIAYAGLAASRRLEALAELFLDFMEPARGKRDDEDDEDE